MGRETSNNNKDGHVKTIRYNLRPDNLVNFFADISNSKKEYKEDIFMVVKLKKEKINLYSIINSEYYSINSLRCLNFAFSLIFFNAVFSSCLILSFE